MAGKISDIGTTITALSPGVLLEVEKADGTSAKIDGANVGSALQAVSVYNNGTQSISNATTTVITFNSEQFDSGTMHSTSSNTSRLVAPATGKYLICYAGNYDSNSSGQRIFWVGKNDAGAGTNANIMFGSAMKIPGSSVATQTLTNTFTAQLSSGDYVEMFTYQDSGGTRTLGAATGGANNGAVVTFSLVYLGP